MVSHSKYFTPLFLFFFHHMLEKAYGNHPEFATPFCGFGGFFFDVDERMKYSGVAFLHFFYQLGLCSMSTSISSGAIAERSNFKAAMLFSSFNILVQIIYFFDGRFPSRHKQSTFRENFL